MHLGLETSRAAQNETARKLPGGVGMWAPEIPQFLGGSQTGGTPGLVTEEEQRRSRRRKEAWVSPGPPATRGEAVGAWGSGQLHFLWNKEMGEERASLSCFSLYLN